MIDGSEPILRVEGLTRRFQGLVALDGVSFTVEPGTVYSIIGPNGAGKTTAFNCISGIYRPSGGTILFEGATISGLKPHKIARLGIARTFQNIELFANVTTMENLMLGRHVHMKAGLWGAATMLSRRSRAAREEVEHRERVERIIDLLDLGWARNRLVRGLPYGTQKLVELGRRAGSPASPSRSTSHRVSSAGPTSRQPWQPASRTPDSMEGSCASSSRRHASWHRTREVPELCPQSRISASRSPWTTSAQATPR